MKPISVLIRFSEPSQLERGVRRICPATSRLEKKLLEGFFKSELGSFFEGPSLNDATPDFELKTQDGKEKIRLSEHIGDKPIVLIFGNYTCGPFRRFYRELDDICHSLKGRIHCFGIYVREAHPEDGWIMESNSRLGVRLPQPKTYEERMAVARTCATKLNYRMPLLVDSIDDTVGNQYSAMPVEFTSWTARGGSYTSLHAVRLDSDQEKSNKR